MKVHKIVQETDDPLVLRIVDSDRDYDRLYHRINQNNYQEGDKKAMIVSVEYIFNPSKKQ